MRSIEDMVAKFRGSLERMVSSTEAEGDERTFRCPKCLDEGYTIHHPETVISQFSGKRIPAGGASTARFCTCDAGLSKEAGLWASKLTPAKGQRTASDEIRAMFLQRQRSHQRGFELRSRVERLINRTAEQQQEEP